MICLEVLVAFPQVSSRTAFQTAHSNIITIVRFNLLQGTEKKGLASGT